MSDGTIKFLLAVGITVILSGVIAYFVMHSTIPMVEPDCFNTSNSLEYQDGTLVSNLKTLGDYKLSVNNETMIIEEIIIIPNDEPQKVYVRERTYEVCNEDVPSDDRNCTSHTVSQNIVFVHRDVSKVIHKYYDKVTIFGFCSANQPL